MSTPHNGAENGAFAKTVLMPGDPLRAKFIAENFLENPQLVTSVRNVLGYTGTYNGKPVSVMASGMGMPSIGIYSFELFTQYGVETIIRIGSAGSYTADLDLYDVVVAESAYSESNYAKTQNGCEDDVLYPSKETNERILAAAEKLGIPSISVRPISTRPKCATSRKMVSGKVCPTIPSRICFLTDTAKSRSTSCRAL